MNADDLLLLLARVLAGGAFIVIGIRILRGLPLVADLLKSKRIPLPKLVAQCGAIIEIVLGALAISGFWLFEVAIAMAAFVIVATLMVHDIWNTRGPQREKELNVILSNTIIVGGLLAIAASAR
ncbi:DoxX family protein [Flaviflagellibacter deserti]|uniref:DoxX family protein n=1 Tax=Flaviflagellibacter deserti TaxID=2267266 RepID=A0ABV9Z3R2_9HYPH